MSTIVYDQEFEVGENTRESLAIALENAANKLREDGEAIVYLGGTVHAHIDLVSETGVTVEV